MKNIAFKQAFFGILLFLVSCKKGDDNPVPAPTEPSPTLTAISPTAGPKNTVVTITGSNFGTSTAAVKVYFNGVQGSLQTITDTQITAVVPAGTTTGNVKVERGTKQVTGPVFTFYGPGTTSTFAGSNVGYLDGTGTGAQFNIPTNIVRDAAGNFFVADRDNHRIRKITPAGVVTTFAGSGTAGFVNGNGTAASFNQPYALAIDASDNLYVGDRINHAIRKITTGGVVTTLAGNGSSGNVNGTGAAARFNEPIGIAVDGSGNVFVADYINSLIRKVTPAGVVTTFAGNGFAMVDGTGTGASFNGPFGLAFDGASNLFVGDYNNNAIRKITTAGVVTTIAGNGNSGTTDGTGSAARFNRPVGMAIDGNGTIYVCDAFNHRIRKITSGGVVTTLAGNGAGFSDGIGTSALFDTPLGICADFANAIIYITDFNNHKIRKVIVD